MVAIVLLACGAAATPAEEKVWSNEAELSLVVTEGNSDTQSFGLKDTFVYRWTKSRFQLKIEALRTATSDDWFEQVDPGFTWEPGADPPPTTRTHVKPPIEPDTENYFIEGRLDREIRKNFTWNAGASWDRNIDAGILGRRIFFAGLGHVWWSREDLKFETSYGLSYTNRRDETFDPERDDKFPGARLSWTYLNKFGKVTTFTNDWVANANLSDVSDWSSDMTNALSVTMSERLALRVSLRWLYNSIPALEDVDVLARVVVLDPDGIPGNGDELFQTVASGGSEVTVGSTDVRKETLDQIFKTTLVISF